jgi:predicted phosphohydrolase
LRICVFADTHGFHSDLSLPEADLLIFAGDMSMSGTAEQISDFAAWWNGLDYPHKLLIAGNHDWLFQREARTARALFPAAEYLEDSEARVLGLRIWGAPWQPWFFDWAFNLQPGPEIRAKWDLIPSGIDILVTHGPPQGQGDFAHRGVSAGCRDLWEAVTQRVKPRWHLFGHIHEGHGVTRAGGTGFINAAICDFKYRPVQSPEIFEI